MASSNATLPRFDTDDARWRAVVERDGTADDMFYYSVQSTGVYCRPSCAARLPLREHVRFHATRAEAEAAGFRACKRCRPGDLPLAERRAELVASACRAIEEAPEPPTLESLAANAGMSAHHFHRVFKSVTGLTPKAYAMAHRAERFRRALANGAAVTDAIFDAGFNSSSALYASGARALGMSPREYRAGGAGTILRFAVGECSLGAILVAASEKGVCAILLGDEPEALVHDLERRFPNANLVGGDAGFEAHVAKVIGFVESPKQGLDLPLDVRGTAFQQRVWQALREIPPGSTATYAEIAERIDAPGAARAVAQACAANPLAVAIPCHRVVRQGGNVSGYRWGVARKRSLLEREARA